MAAEVLAGAGLQVDVYDSMPSVGRKFLLAGKGGLNLTHSESPAAFLSRYGNAQDAIAPLLCSFGPEDLMAWARGLGIEVFRGSSGRIFPVGMKAAPLLRGWLHRLRLSGVRFHPRHRWIGWDASGGLRFVTPQGEVCVSVAATVLAPGGGSWPQLGSDAAWVRILEDRGLSVAPLQPANCGFDIAGGWSAHLRDRFAGHPLKPVVLQFTDRNGAVFQRQGEFVLTSSGVEGSLIYAASAALREEIAATGEALIHLDLLPDRTPEWVSAEVAHPRGARSMSSHLQSRCGLKGVKVGLLRELVSATDFAVPGRLAAAVKALPLRLVAPRPLAESISTAGGVRFSALDEGLMLRESPGVFCAGEMLDWEAPTGGYLLTACFASGRAAGLGVRAWLEQRSDGLVPLSA